MNLNNNPLKSALFRTNLVENIKSALLNPEHPHLNNKKLTVVVITEYGAEPQFLLKLNEHNVDFAIDLLNSKYSTLRFKSSYNYFRDTYDIYVAA